MLHYMRKKIAVSIANWLSFGYSRIIAHDRAAHDEFGASVDTDSTGTTMVVGSPFDDDKGSGSGGAYVYVISEGNWIFQQKLVASDGAANDIFGAQVAISGDGNTVVVSAWGDNSYAGSLYVFTRQGTTWTQQQKLVTTPIYTEGWLGRYSVALSKDGTTIAVGAPSATHSSVNNPGRTFIFSKVGNSWSQQANLISPTVSNFGNFGRSVCLSADGNILAVSENLTVSGNQFAGAVRLFIRLGGAWYNHQSIPAPEPKPSGAFGRALAFSDSGHTLVIGAPNEDFNGISSAGRVYVYKRDSNAVWYRTAYAAIPDPEQNGGAELSLSLNADGTLLAVGMPFMDPGGTSSGSIYVFTTDETRWYMTKKIVPDTLTSSDSLGISVSFNGSGSVLAAGAYKDDSVGLVTGAAYVFTSL